ncbi:MAG: hypothetical protein ACXAC2_25805, partial [Candidatus Kariarchaeaceae archaeon]
KQNQRIASQNIIFFVRNKLQVHLLCQLNENADTDFLKVFKKLWNNMFRIPWSRLGCGEFY